VDAKRFERVRDVFEQTVARPAAERVAFLADVCHDDAELRQEVESLLAHDDQARADFLRPLAMQAPGGLRDLAPDEPDPFVGRRIGRYLVKQVINTGGMGTVYLAEQDSPRRDVALKVMKAGVFTTRSALRRFEYESQILAKLRHPNIAHVYDAGTFELLLDGEVAASSRLEEAGGERDEARPGEARPPHPSPLPQGGEGIAWSQGGEGIAPPHGRRTIPYFAMEYIPEARSITRFARERRLGHRQRLELFLTVCDAVAHGHTRGVIHRDIKPGNILVDAAGTAKVIDFGVAKSTDSDVAVTTLRTEVGQLVGTLQYMSPEQCEADPHNLDTRTDVYSLGVVLYELLTDRLPYDVSNMTIHSAVRHVCEQPPAPPSRFNRRLRGDLEAVLLKALEKAPGRRYGSVAELAADLRRHLDGEPISVRAPSAWTRALRWLTRHPIWTTTAACLLVAIGFLLGFRVLGYWMYYEPYRLVAKIGIAPWDIEQVDLMSRGGTSLETWGGVGTDARMYHIRFAQEAERIGPEGKQRLLVFGFHCAPNSRNAPGLAVYDMDGDLDKPLWRGCFLSSEEIPERLRSRDFVPEQFGVWRALCADVFPEPEGSPQALEIIAIFKQRATTHSSIRVYDLSGNVLSEVWMDFQVNNLCWASGPGVLVCMGLNGEAPLEDRGCMEATHVSHPWAIFAVRPQRGVRTLDYLVQETADRAAAPEHLRPLWYRCLLPLEASQSVAVTSGFADLAASEAGANRVCVNLAFSAEYPAPRSADEIAGVNLSWILDAATGEVVRGPIPKDDYIRNRALSEDDPKRFPPPDHWTWGDLPPILHKTPVDPSLEPSQGKPR